MPFLLLFCAFRFFTSDNCASWNTKESENIIKKKKNRPYVYIWFDFCVFMYIIIKKMLIISILIAICIAPLFASGTNSNSIKKEYIIQARPNADITLFRDLFQNVRGKNFWHIPNAETGDFIAFSGEFNANALQHIMQHHDLIEIVEEDMIISADVDQTNPPSWGLGAVSSATCTNQGVFSYPAHGGAGVTVFVIDTGIRCSHAQFTGRCTFGARFGNGGLTDPNGHGTHVAGTVAGTSYGVAKSATLVAVGVLGPAGTGATSNVISGINYAVGACTGHCVATLAMSSTGSTVLDNAVNAAVSANFFIVAAAGNSNVDISNTSPARAADAYTVMGSNTAGNKVASSNFGPGCSIWAPGSNIVSAWNTTDTATKTMTGTSFACPHAAGAAALAFASGQGSSSRTAMKEYLNSKATTGVITGVPAGTTTRFLYVDEFI